jgi:AcrR family transcriptional regulator
MKRGLSPQTEYEVMEATREVLGREGLSGLTLDRVAGQTNGDAKVHDHYDSPVELVTAFVDYERDRFEEFLMMTADDPNLRFRALLDVAVGLEGVEEDGLVPAYLEMHAQASENEQLREALFALDSEIRDSLAETIRNGIQEGTFEAVDPEAAAAIIYATHISTAVKSGLGADTADIRDGLDEFVLSAIRKEP